jgi:hypothetical protein
MIGAAFEFGMGIAFVYVLLLFIKDVCGVNLQLSKHSRDHRKQLQTMLAEATGQLKALELLLSMEKAAHNKTVGEWNSLVREINKRGGREFLEGRTATQSPPVGPKFSADEITELIKLCHPDKHGNSAEANAMTRRLLALRKPKK